MPDGFIKLSEFFNKEPGLAPIRKKLNDSGVIARFYDIFPDLQQVAVPVKVEKNLLFIRVENPAWRNELKFREKAVVEKINKYFSEQESFRGKESIKGLKFT